MGFRSLLEINHDNTSQMEDAPSSFVAMLSSYIRAGSPQIADTLYSRFNIKVVGMRHSSDPYYISKSQWGFPSKLPWDDFVKERDEALAKATALTGGKRKPRTELEDMIHELVAIIERQQEILDRIP